MSEKIEVTKEEIFKLMLDSFKSGVSSYFDLADESCLQLLNDFLIKKTNTTTSMNLLLGSQQFNCTASWHHQSYESFISNVFG